MSRKGQSITLSISDRDKAELEAIAHELGIKWGDRPNISKLVLAITRRQLLVFPNNNWSETRIRALERSIYALTDIGPEVPPVQMYFSTTQIFIIGKFLAMQVLTCTKNMYPCRYCKNSALALFLQ